MKEYKYKINGNTYKVVVGDVDNNQVEVLVNGTPYKVELDSAPVAPVKVSAPKAAAAPRSATGEKIISKPAVATGSAYAVKAPLPGVVLSINNKVGDVVKSSDTVVVLEAMKMENAIHAGRDGKIASINVAASDSVLEGAVLFTIE